MNKAGPLDCAPDHATSMRITREGWLLDATARLADCLFKPLGHDVPEVMVSIGFARADSHRNVIGQCWPRSRAADQRNQIFIAPTLSAYEAIDTLAHELIHAVDDCQHKHGKEFKKLALALGMQGPMRSAAAGPALKARLEAMLSELPPYPHAPLQIPKKPLKINRSYKALCEQCGYRLTVPKRFLHLGAPICPADNVQMREVGDWTNA